MKYLILAKNYDQQKQMLRALATFGAKNRYACDRSVEDMILRDEKSDGEAEFSQYPYVKVEFGECGFSVCMAANSNGFKTISFGELMEKVVAFATTPQPIEISDVGEYTAIVQHNKIVKVGCQNIPFAKVKEIYSAVEKMEKQIDKTPKPC